MHSPLCRCQFQRWSLCWNCKFCWSSAGCRWIVRRGDGCRRRRQSAVGRPWAAGFLQWGQGGCECCKSQCDACLLAWHSAARAELGGSPVRNAEGSESCQMRGTALPTSQSRLSGLNCKPCSWLAAWSSRLGEQHECTAFAVPPQATRKMPGKWLSTMLCCM